MSNYCAIIKEIVKNNYKQSSNHFDFNRIDIRNAAINLNLKIPDNIGDLVYAFKYRQKLPEEINKILPKNKEWYIHNIGKGQYRFEVCDLNNIIPNNQITPINIPDATPSIVKLYSQNDEQSLLTKIRYNRLIDLFLGTTMYYLQNHLRTSVKGIGQIEIDEIYVGVDRNGCLIVSPVQAKIKDDKHSITQTLQDIAYCKEKYDEFICRPVSVQYKDNKMIMFELSSCNNKIKLVAESHYCLQG